MSNTEQQNKVRQPGFIAALDQSGGSTPAALARYGVPEDSYGSEEEMFDLVHEMRCRIMRSPAFSSDFVFGAILFEQTMERDVDGMPTARHLWERRGIVPFLKVDEGLAGESGGMRLMKPVNGLSALLERGVERGVFGTKMRSVIDAAAPEASTRSSRSNSRSPTRSWIAGWYRSLSPRSRFRSPTRPRPRACCATGCLRGSTRCPRIAR